MTQGPLWKVVIINVDIAPQGRRQVLTGATAVGRQDLADAAVKRSIMPLVWGWRGLMLSLIHI